MPSIQVDPSTAPRRRLQPDRMSHTPVIDVDRDESPPRGVRRRRPDNERPTTAVRRRLPDNDDGPPRNRRRIASGTHSHPVLVADDDGPIIVSDDDDDIHRAPFRIFSPSPPPAPLIAEPLPFALLPPRQPQPQPQPQPRPASPRPRSAAPAIHLGGGLLAHTPRVALPGIEALFGLRRDDLLERLLLRWPRDREPPAPAYDPARGRAGPGWTFDIGTPDEILVCARCLAPMLSNTEGLNEEERRARRVWGLRCGHMLDGKCVGELMQPREDAEEAEVVALVQPRDRKGKGRARTPPPPAAPPTAPPAPPANPIRSRLRSHGRPARVLPEPTVTIRRARRKRSVEEEEVIEARHEWACPVAGCGRIHHSVRVRGVWRMDAEDGAVGVFV